MLIPRCDFPPSARREGLVPLLIPRCCLGRGPEIVASSQTKNCGSGPPGGVPEKRCLQAAPDALEVETSVVMHVICHMPHDRARHGVRDLWHGAGPESHPRTKATVSPSIQQVKISPVHDSPTHAPSNITQSIQFKQQQGAHQCNEFTHLSEIWCSRLFYANFLYIEIDQ